MPQRQKIGKIFSLGILSSLFRRMHFSYCQDVVLLTVTFEISGDNLDTIKSFIEDAIIVTSEEMEAVMQGLKDGMK